MAKEMNLGGDGKMILKEVIKLLLLSFLPTSMLGLFTIFEDKIDIHSNNVANIIAVIIVPLYLAFVGNLIIVDNNISNKITNSLIVFVSAFATIHAIHMLYGNVWQHVFFLPDQLDGISKTVLNIIIVISLVVLLISYPILNAIISKFKSSV